MKIAIDPGHGMGNRRAGVFDPGATRRVFSNDGDRSFLIQGANRDAICQGIFEVLTGGS